MVHKDDILHALNQWHNAMRTLNESDITAGNFLDENVPENGIVFVDDEEKEKPVVTYDHTNVAYIDKMSWVNGELYVFNHEQCLQCPVDCLAVGDVTYLADYMIEYGYINLK